jgi:hypothetical protein
MMVGAGLLTKSAGKESPLRLYCVSTSIGGVQTTGCSLSPHPCAAIH